MQKNITRGSSLDLANKFERGFEHEIHLFSRIGAGSFEVLSKKFQNYLFVNNLKKQTSEEER